MRRVVSGLAAVLITLGCGGLASPEPVAPAPAVEEVAPKGPKPMEGIWCESDSPYCYEFAGDVVTEDLGPGRRASGTWEIHDDLLQFHYKNPSQTFTWQITKRTDAVLMVLDLQANETVIWNRHETMPARGDRPR